MYNLIYEAIAVIVTGLSVWSFYHHRNVMRARNGLDAANMIYGKMLGWWCVSLIVGLAWGFILILILVGLVVFLFQFWWECFRVRRAVRSGTVNQTLLPPEIYRDRV